MSRKLHCRSQAGNSNAQASVPVHSRVPVAARGAAGVSECGRTYWLILIFILLLQNPLIAERFYPDDPLEVEPPPFPVQGPEPRQLNELLEFVSNALSHPGEQHPERGVISAAGVNTLGEVMDGPWYVNRHQRKPMNQEELLQGPGDDKPPSPDGKWEVLIVKRYGFRPGIIIRDSNERIYFLRFDPPDSLETMSGAQMVGSRIHYALGYHVPQNYIAYVQRDRLIVSEEGQDVTSFSEVRKLTKEHIDDFLEQTAMDPNRGYRAVAVLVPGEAGGILGPYQFYGLRSDDPNDIVPHEHRRDLRGLFVFSAWLNHDQMRAMNSLDILTKQDDIPYIKHYLVDFTGTLGSGVEGPKSAWRGNDQLLGGKSTLKNILGFGIYSPGWMRADYPKIQGVGSFEYETFDPERWTTNYDLAPFANRLPDDTFWAARKVVAFTDDDIRTMVSAGQYTDPRAEAWITKCLIERRNRIAKTYFSKVLPLDHFAVTDGKLTFRDLEIEFGFVSSRNYTARWFEFDNRLDVLANLTNDRTDFSLPNTALSADEGRYFAARIVAEHPEKEVTVYLRRELDDYRVVGLDYSWPGKVLADPAKDIDTGKSRYVDLEEEQRQLFERYTAAYNEKAERDLAAQEYFDSLSISERTTYDAVTDALIKSKLTDANGNSLGRPIDLVQEVEHIAGQYYGRSGDQQFRVYARIDPKTKEILEKSREFFEDHPNTVYHAGFPISYRQEGKEPTIQFSISEEGTKADIDVDYRSSKSPQALFNGHLTSANSDVRAGDNHLRHTRRWKGLIAWWQEFFGSIQESVEKEQRNLLATGQLKATPLPPNRPAGAQIPQIHDAVQEFLTDWLVREKYGEAIDFLSTHAYACLNIDEDYRLEALDVTKARKELLEIMEYSRKELGNMRNLTQALEAFPPWDPNRVVLKQTFEKEFTLIQLDPEEVGKYMCRNVQADPSAGVEYFGVLFRFRREGSAVLGLLWGKEADRWRILAYRSFEQ